MIFVESAHSPESVRAFGEYYNNNAHFSEKQRHGPLFLSLNTVSILTRTDKKYNMYKIFPRRIYEVCFNMEYMGLNEIREKFLSFFESKGHLRLPSFSLIPQNDASLLLINSGMAPMKTYFTGEQEPPRRRVCTCQKCVRTGDIENIGKTARHGTYFEMLGNFSFGDYFKHEAIAWCWEFLTEVMKLDPQRLYPSIYEDDDEAFEIWNKEIGIPAERIFRFGKEDNFWEHGSGPCGPCSEVYYDRGEKYGCGKPDCTVGCDCDRYMEIWNNVFSQFNNDGEGHYTELVQKNIDTGMGLERLACVMQDVDSLFDVDTVMNITNHVSEITGARYGQSHSSDVSLRVITDHIRSATMMICDGVLPSNEGRGYVLRRLLRRAARHGRLLGVDRPFLYEVCATVIKENVGAYPDLGEKQSYITRVIKTEEESFAKTIDGGMRIFSELLATHKQRGETTFSGADAFKLYDTYGFPVDLTVEMLSEEGMELDRAEFDQLMSEQRERARTARAALGDLAWAGIDLGLDTTPTAFTGYDTLTSQAKVLALVAEGEVCSTLRAGEDGIVVLDSTPFYAEMGGQVADHGVIRSASGAEFVVTDVQKSKAGKYLHYGKLGSGSLSVDDTVDCEVDRARRASIMRAHSATHLLQKALREVLGEHVQQAGSLVEPDRLRFDFTHFSAMTEEEIAKVEHRINEQILAGLNVDTKEMPIAEAKALGAMALFGEKYGDVVRVVRMGDYSVELCGGTHLDNTAKAGCLKILSEASVASGVRRIEAVTGAGVLAEYARLDTILHEAAGLAKTSVTELPARLKQNSEEIKNLRRELEKLKAKEASGGVVSMLASAPVIGSVKAVTAKVEAEDAASLRMLGDSLRDRDAAVAAVLASVNGEKVTFLAVCGTDAIAAGIKAGDLVREACRAAGGNGGGKPDSAMGGGRDAARIDDALNAALEYIRSKLG